MVEIPAKCKRGWRMWWSCLHKSPCWHSQQLLYWLRQKKIFACRLEGQGHTDIGKSVKKRSCSALYSWGYISMFHWPRQAACLRSQLLIAMPRRQFVCLASCSHVQSCAVVCRSCWLIFINGLLQGECKDCSKPCGARPVLWVAVSCDGDAIVIHCQFNMAGWGEFTAATPARQNCNLLW